MSRVTRTGVLLTLTVVLLAATLLLPWPIAARWTGASWTGPQDFTRAVADALVSDWAHQVPDPGQPGSTLADPANFWRVFHLVKAVLAGLLLTVSGVLVVRCWPARRDTGSWLGHTAGVVASGASGLLAGISLLVLVANIQGALAPLSSALSFLPPAHRDAALASTAQQVRSDLAAGPHSTATSALLQDFAAYHLAMAVLGAVTTLALAALVVAMWRGHHRIAGVPVLGATLAFALVTVANVSTALVPAPALDGFLRTATG